MSQGNQFADLASDENIAIDEMNNVVDSVNVNPEKDVNIVNNVANPLFERQDEDMNIESANAPLGR